MCLAASVLLLGFDSSFPAQSVDYPEKQINWIVPFSPGGGFDAYSRVIAKTLPRYLMHKVNVVIKNVPGAGGRRAAGVLYRAKPDGYTIGMINPIGLATNDLVKKSTQYDLMEFTYLVTCNRGTPGIFVAANSAFDSIEDLQKAERIKFATAGRGSGTWLWGMLVKGIMNIPAYMVSGYSGTSEYVIAMLRKDIDAFALGFASPLLPYCHAGEIKPLMFFTRESWAPMPEVKTLKGTPYAELADFYNDRVLAGPPDLPENISRILEDALINTLNDPELQAWSKKTNNPINIGDSKSTLHSLDLTIGLLKKYENLFKD